MPVENVVVQFGKTDKKERFLEFNPLKDDYRIFGKFKSN